MRPTTISPSHAQSKDAATRFPSSARRHSFRSFQSSPNSSKTACTRARRVPTSAIAWFLEAYTQLLTTSTLVGAQFSYGRLTTLQVGVDERPSTEAGFQALETVDSIKSVTMEDCHDYVVIRRLIAMHAVWLMEDSALEPATGTCSLFVAARDRQQLTLWQSFFQHARSVVDIAHFRASVPVDSAFAISRPSSGLDCDPSLQDSSRASAGGLNARTEWRACMWWSEFTHDQQSEDACSPDQVCGPFKSHNSRAL